MTEVNSITVDVSPAPAGQTRVTVDILVSEKPTGELLTVAVTNGQRQQKINPILLSEYLKEREQHDMPKK